MMTMKKKFDSSRYTSKAYKFWIKERVEEISCLKEEIKIFKVWYKEALKRERNK